MVDENDNLYVRLGKGRKERVVKLYLYFFKFLEDYRNYFGFLEVIIFSDDFIFII